jgi:Transposase IS116/IS110/IS902 family
VGATFAEWLGLVPRQVTTGGKSRLAGISKRDNKYLRKLIIQGARAALPSLATSVTPLGGWLRALMQRVHKNAAVVALANKLARIVWSCCVEVRSLTLRPSGRRHKRQSADARHQCRSATDVCWRWKRDGLTVDRRSGTLVKKWWARRREVYEDWNARISLWARVMPTGRIR